MKNLLRKQQKRGLLHLDERNHGKRYKHSKYISNNIKRLQEPLGKASLQKMVQDLKKERTIQLLRKEAF